MQTNKSFSVSEALRSGWEMFKKNPLFWMGVTGVVMFFSFLSASPSFVYQMSVGDFEAEIPPLINILGFLLSFVSLGIQLGLLVLLINAHRGREQNFSILFSKFQIVPLIKFWVASLLYGLMVVIGVLLLIVPGIYFGIKYQYFAYFIAEKDAGIIESFKLSGDLTKGIKSSLFGLAIVSILIALVGAFISFGLALFIIGPIINLATTYVYCKFSGSNEASPASEMPRMAQSPMAEAQPLA